MLCELIAAGHCPFIGAAQAYLLRYGLRYRSNSGSAGTEPDETLYERTGIITHDEKRQYKIFETIYRSVFQRMIFNFNLTRMRSFESWSPTLYRSDHISA